MTRWSPKTVLVTGASSGIGRAIALEYGKRGAHVMSVARRLPELESLTAEISRSGGRASHLVCDVADAQAAFDVVKEAASALGSLDMVVANAGIGQAKHASRLTLDDVTKTVDVNVRGAMATLVSAIPIMLDQKRGHLVAVSSLAARRALPGTGAYNASKAALATFLETLQLDLDRSGLRVTDVQPGFVETPMTTKATHPRPFLWEADKAARVIADRLERGPRVIAFPWQLDALMLLAKWLPYPLLARLTRNARG